MRKAMEGEERSSLTDKRSGGDVPVHHQRLRKAHYADERRSSIAARHVPKYARAVHSRSDFPLHWSRPVHGPSLPCCVQYPCFS